MPCHARSEIAGGFRAKPVMTRELATHLSIPFPSRHAVPSGRWTRAVEGNEWCQNLQVKFGRQATFALEPVTNQELSELPKHRWMKSRIPARDAFSTFVPAGSENDRRIALKMQQRAGGSRWLPV